MTITFSISTRIAAAIVGLSPTQVETVQLAGEWDNFTPEDMTDTDDVWMLDKTFDPGSYAYKFLVNGIWILDPQGCYAKKVGGVSNSFVVIPFDVASLPTEDPHDEGKPYTTGGSVMVSLG